MRLVYNVATHTWTCNDRSGAQYEIILAGTAATKSRTCRPCLYDRWMAPDSSCRCHTGTATPPCLGRNPRYMAGRAGITYTHVDGQHENAEAEFLKAMEINPNLFEPIHFYAQMARSMERYEKAAELFELAARARPEDYQAMALAANMHAAIGDTAKCLEAAKETVIRVKHALELNPADPRALVLGAGSLHYTGDIETAVAWVERAFKLDPESSSTAYNSACLFANIGEIERALDCIELAIKLGSRNERYYQTDVDLNPLREHPRFIELMKRL
jgi:tetratricopeptide (TPR) repeat protein